MYMTVHFENSFLPFTQNCSIALTESGHLLEICPFTRCINLRQPPRNANALLIDDMLVMECNDENVELIILTKLTPDGDRFIRIVEYPCKIIIFL